jgi:hypothetical protein
MAIKGIVGFLAVAILAAPAAAGGDGAIAGFQSELSKGQQLHRQLSDQVAAKHAQEKGPSQAYDKAQAALQHFAAQLSEQAKAAKALIPAIKSRNVGLQTAAAKALLNKTGELASLRERTAHDVEEYLKPPTR